MFARFVTVVGVAHEGRTVVGSPSLSTTLRNIDLVRGSIASSLAICRVSISVVVDDVAALVDFQHGLEFGIGDNVHGGRQRVTEMQLYAKVAPLHQMEAGAISLVGGQIKTEEGVTVPCVRIGRRGHGRAVQVNVDLTEQRMQPVIHWSHGIGQVEIVLIGLSIIRYAL